MGVVVVISIRLDYDVFAEARGASNLVDSSNYAFPRCANGNAVVCVNISGKLGSAEMRRRTTMNIPWVPIALIADR